MTSDSPLGAQVSSFEPLGVSGARDIAFTLTIPDVARSAFRPGNVETFQGPWVFHFTLPIAAARVVEPGPTFTRQGVDLTFTRIVVAPSATRFEYRVHLPGFKDRVGAGLVLSGLGRGSGHTSVGQVFVLRPEGWGGGPLCQLDGEDFECAYVLTEPLFDMDALHVDATVSIPDREPCSPRQVCQVARDDKPFSIEFDGLLIPLR